MAGVSSKSTQRYSGFSPQAIPGCALWLDGRDPLGTGVLPSNGTAISTWKDKSGSNNSPTSSSGTYPTYNTASNAVVWTGGAQQLTFPTTISTAVVGKAFTVFLVERRTAGAPNNFIVRGTNQAANSNLLIGYESSNLRRFAFYGNDLDATVPTYAANEAASIACFMYSKPGRTIFNNGALTASASNTNAVDLASWTGAMIGGNSIWTGYSGLVYEALIYSTSLSSNDRQQVEGYLGWKWGLQTSLPATHPYRGNIRPYTRPFQPLDIPGCALWLDAADRTSMTFSGSNVLTWNDKSSLANSITRVGTPTLTTPSNFKIGGVTFNGTDSYFSNTTLGVSLTNYSVFFVCEQTSYIRGTLGILVLTNGNSQDYSSLNTFVYTSSEQLGTPSYLTMGNGAGFFRPAPYSLTPFSVYGDVTSGTSKSIYRNGNLLQTQTFNSLTSSVGFVVGARKELGSATISAFFSGLIGEVLIYNAALTGPQRQQVEGYLAAKWGLTANLPLPTPVLGFTPLNIPGCTLWLDAADSTSMTLSGSNVTAWADKSGGGRNASSAGTSTPILSNSSIVFNGAGRFSTSYSSIQTIETFFIVFRATVSSSFVLAGGASTNQRFFYVDPASSRWIYLGAIAVWGAWNTVPFAIGTRHLTGFSWSSPSSRTLFLNGSTLTSLSTAGTPGAFSGTPTSTSIGDGLTGEINEVIGYNAVLTGSQQQQLEGYLASKWSLQANLPAHPFKLYPPLVTAFSPLQIPGCALWLDAADRSTLTLSGSNVTQWNDKSGNGLNATIPAVSGIVNPVHAVGGQNGNSILQFRSGSDGMVVLGNNFLSATAPSLCYILAIRLSATQPGNFYQGIISTDRPGFYGRGLGISGTVYQELYHSGFLNTAVTWSSSWAIIELHFNGTTSATLYLNGTATAVTASAASLNNNQGLKIGCYNYTDIGIAAYNANFDVGEIIVLTTVPTTLQRQQLEGYLAGKWGTTGALPSTHPFKNIMP